MSLPDVPHRPQLSDFDDPAPGGPPPFGVPSPPPAVPAAPSPERFLKPSLSIRQQLGYRYLVSVEGNDVASGLKWMLASNSTVLMPPPQPPPPQVWVRWMKSKFV